MTSKVLTEQGWVEGKAAPKLLPEKLRELPSDYVTNEIEDQNRVHELDPEHVRLAVVEERTEAETGAKPAEEPTLPKLPDKKHTTCTQENIDLIRLRVLSVLVNKNAERIAAGLPPDLGVRHLWFADDDVLGQCELRMGNPPPQRDRPRHLRFRHLEIDPAHMPETIMSRIGKDPELRKAYEKHITKPRQSAIVDVQGNPMVLP